jgi:hypothetical protein
MTGWKELLIDILKIISFNMDRWIDDKNNVCKSYVVEVIEKVGKDWLVTRGNNLNLTQLKNPVQDIGKVLTEEGEPGQPINDSQWLQLQEVLKR